MSALTVEKVLACHFSFMWTINFWCLKVQTVCSNNRKGTGMSLFIYVDYKLVVLKSGSNCLF